MKTMVTDHALVRYLERVEGVCTKAARKKLSRVAATVPPETIEMMGDRDVHIKSDGITYSFARSRGNPAQLVLVSVMAKSNK